jgi:hypothetical protein
MIRARLRLMALAMLLVILAPLGHAMAKPKDEAGALTLPLAGTSPTGATFTGTFTVNRFVAQGSAVFAEGVLSGTVSSSGLPVGTALQVPVRLPVTGNWSPVARRAPGRGADIVLVQSTCGVLHIDLGAVNLNLLGIAFSTSPISLDLSGNTAGPLGTLVCAVLGVVGSVANLVNLLNQILGALTGALGGVV